MDSARAADGERRVANDQWDIDGWHILASEAEKCSFQVAKPVYERLVKQFPPIGKFWRSYAEHLTREQPENHTDITAIYDRAVKSAPTSIDLWRSFLKYVSARAAEIPGSKLESDAIAVHERAVKCAGLDLNAHSLWTHYIDFVKKQTMLSDSQRRDALRRVYHRAVRTPMHNLDAFWRDYTTFEQTSNTNKEIGRTHLAENQPKNIDARAEFRARKTRREGLTLSALPVPPRGRAKESSQAQQWRRFILHERSNPSSLADSDLHERVLHAYESALAPMHRYPDFWIEYISYVHSTLGGEVKQTIGKSHDSKDSNSNANSVLTKKMAETLEPILERAIAAVPHSVALHTHASWLYTRIAEPGKGVIALDALCKSHPSPLAYVHLMRATRKHEGRDAARKVFGRARKDPKGTHPSVYVAAALMEFSVNKDSKVARNVFEFGLKNFAKNAVMATEYVNWLWGTGDLEYARVVLKKVMPDAKGTPAEVRRLWERWIDLEELIGDASTVDQVEAIWKENGVARPETVVSEVLRRTRFLGFEGFSENEVGAVNGNRAGASDKATGASTGGGGRRDPRTGRRVGSSGSNKESVGNGTSQRRVGDEGQGSVLKVAIEMLQRMASALPPVGAPPPNPDVLFRMIENTPDSFLDTPVGRNAGGGSRKGKDNMASKKRKSEEITHIATSAAIGIGVGAPDVFRARQAAKQARTR
ncbi:cleavage stimulation factor 77 [Gracilaria domingensis]|nr:cleavage stimulation factor 77 [Gracilaria domingensis]